MDVCEAWCHFPANILNTDQNKCDLFVCFDWVTAFIHKTLKMSRICGDVLPICCSWASPSGSWFHPFLCLTWMIWTSWGTTSESCSTSIRGSPPLRLSSWFWVRLSGSFMKKGEACLLLISFRARFSSVCLCSISGQTRDPAFSGAGSSQTHPARGELVRCFSVEAAAQPALHAPGAQLWWVPFSRFCS